MEKIIMISLIIIIIFIILIPAINILLKTQKSQVNNIYLNSSDKKTYCSSSRVKCLNDSDCNGNCVSDMEYTCQNITNPDGNKNPDKFCLPVNTNENCDIRKGCIPVWTGWGNTNRMEWSNLCSFSSYFGGIGCNHTPGVCEVNGINFMTDRDYSISPPKFEDCVLPRELIDQGYTIKQRMDGTPIIIPPGQGNYYKY